MIALDTNVVVDLVRRNASVRAHFAQAMNAQASLAISTFVLQELIFGAEVSGQAERERTKLGQILAGVAVLPFEAADADVGGRTQALMQKQGLRAPIGDFIVGVHALARGATLVTANTRHFKNIPGLKLVDWTKPPEALQD
jgi:tRNA(fMet)-specific endonuclease VapC